MNEQLIEENTGSSMNEDEQQQHSQNDTNTILDKEMIDEQDYIEDNHRLDDYDDHSSDDYEHGDDDSADGIIQYAMRKNKSTHNILNKIKLFPMEVSYKNKEGQHPLHTACFFRYNYGAIKLIEAYPEAVKHYDCNGYYPLHMAIWKKSSEDVIMKLIAIYPEAVSIPTRYGDTPLCLACKTNGLNQSSETLIQNLIEMYPFAIQVKDQEDKHPIFHAIKNEQKIEVIKMLLNGDPFGMQRRYEFGYKNTPLHQACTPFHQACTIDGADLVQSLIQRSDLQINARNNFGRTPLHIACYNHHVKNVETLLHHPDLDINALDFFNNTPLHSIVESNNNNIYNIELCVQIVQELLDHPFILIQEKSYYNKTPMESVKAQIDQLEKFNDKLTTSQEVQLKCYVQMIHLLKDFQLKQKWQSYMCIIIRIFNN